MANSEIRFVGDMQRLQLLPGDRLVLSVPGTISAEVADRLKKQMEDWVRDPSIRVAVLADGLKVGVVGPAAPSAED